MLLASYTSLYWYVVCIWPLCKLLWQVVCGLWRLLHSFSACVLLNCTNGSRCVSFTAADVGLQLLFCFQFTFTSVLSKIKRFIC